MPPKLSETFGISDVTLFYEGKKLAFTGLANATILPEKPEIDDSQIYAKLTSEPLEFTVNCTIPRKLLMALEVGDNKRMIRRALRWYERLRRMEKKYADRGVKINNKLHTACTIAKWTQNTRKKRGIFSTTFYFERV